MDPKQKNKWESRFCDLLKSQFEIFQKKTGGSLRGYARKLRVSPGTLSDLISKKNKWHLTPERAEAIIARLEAPQQKCNSLLVAMGKEPKHLVSEVTNSNYDMLLDWTFIPILCFFDLPESFHKPNVIAERLGVTESKVRSVIHSLQVRGYIKKLKDGSYTKDNLYLRTTDDIPNQTIQKHHEVNLLLARKAIRKLKPKDRDFTSITFTGNENQIYELKNKIRELCKSASAIMNSPEGPNQVFKLSIQLFPFDHTKTPRIGKK